MATKHGLGRGLDRLIKDGTEAPSQTPATGGRQILMVPVRNIRRNPFQPRHTFNEDTLAELTASIRERGILQPLLVRPVGSGYELIAGERRLRAASAAGLTEVPVISSDTPDQQSLEVALIENLQREDLNPMDEAEGYALLAEKFSLTQEQIAERVGKARVSVTHALRLLDLPSEVQRMLSDNTLRPGHAKVLLGLTQPEEQIHFARRAADETLSVRQLETMVKKAGRKPSKQRAFRADIPREHLQYISDKLHQHFGTSIRVTPCRTFANGKKGKGIIELDFFSNDELDRILNMLGISLD